MPQLPGLVRFLFIQLILKFGIPSAQKAVEFGLVLDIVEIELLPWCEDNYLLREVTIRWVIQGVCERISLG